MKKALSLVLALVLCLSLCACSMPSVGAPATTQPAPTTEPDYSVIVPEALQGVWCDPSVEGLLTMYAFKDNNINTYVVNIGVAASEMLSGTYTVEDGKVNYDFTGGTGYSDFTYENDTLSLTNANGNPITKLTAADLMTYLTQEEGSGNKKGVICLADMIINYFADSAECSAATEKKNAALEAIKSEGAAALDNMTTQYDAVQKLTWYQHENQPEYIDVCCYIYPYIGRMDDGTTWLRVSVNYTDAQTDAGWIFFKKLTFSVDGVNTVKTFNYNDISRDNDTEVWETADFEPSATDIQLLRQIAASEQTIIRFEGDQYYVDHTVTSQEKAAILDVLAAYDYLSNYAD